MFLKIKSLLSPADTARADVYSPGSSVRRRACVEPSQYHQGEPAGGPAGRQLRRVGASTSRQRCSARANSRISPCPAADRATTPVPVRARDEVRSPCGLRTHPAVRHAMRSDLSCTIFVADPGSYEGGELAIVAGNQTVAFKGGAGEAIVYPSTLLHEVAPVRSGERPSRSPSSRATWRTSTSARRCTS